MANRTDAILGVLAAGVCGMALGYVTLGPGVNDRLKTFVYSDSTKIIKSIETAKKDILFKETSPGSGEYILLEDYLNNIPDRYDRGIERLKIEKLVERQ